MSNLLNTIKSYSNTPIPKTLQEFYHTEHEKYTDCQIANLPGWAPDCQFDLDFSESTIIELMDRHKDWITSESKNDNCNYIPFSSLGDETDFLAINISQTDCPVCFGNHETGEFIIIYNTLESFLQYLDNGEVNPMESFIDIYEEAKTAFYDDDVTLVVDLLGDFFNKHQINPAEFGPFMKQIPDALNLLACSYNDLDEPEQAMEVLEQACKAMFCRNAYLNRIKFNLILSNYDIAMNQCNDGLERFSDDYSTSFINLYKGIIYGISEKNKKALECFSLMVGDVEKSNFNTLTPVAGIFTHYTEASDFEEVFNETLEIIRGNE